jgi:hypothetical protein
LGRQTLEKVDMAQPLRIAELNEKLRASGRIDGSHAMQLRRMIYANGTVNHEAGKLLLGLDRACSKKDPAFAQLYVEALTDYFVWQTEPKGYVSPEAHGSSSTISAPTAIETRPSSSSCSISSIGRGTAPKRSCCWCWTRCARAFFFPARPRSGANRPRTSIGAGDVAILRKALHAPAGDGSLLVTRREAELLFTLNDATVTGGNDPEWSDFFSRAIANHLLNPAHAPVIPSREDAARRERWLNERGSIGEFLSGIGSALSRGDIPVRTVFEEVCPAMAASDEKAAEAEARATREMLGRETIDSAEAAWLAKRILQDDTIDDNERALLAFLKSEAKAIDPALKPLLARAKL